MGVNGRTVGVPIELIRPVRSCVQNVQCQDRGGDLDFSGITYTEKQTHETNGK